MGDLEGGNLTVLVDSGLAVPGNSYLVDIGADTQLRLINFTLVVSTKICQIIETNFFQILFLCAYFALLSLIAFIYSQYDATLN